MTKPNQPNMAPHLVREPRKPETGEELAQQTRDGGFFHVAPRRRPIMAYVAAVIFWVLCVLGVIAFLSLVHGRRPIGDGTTPFGAPQVQQDPGAAARVELVNPLRPTITTRVKVGSDEIKLLLEDLFLAEGIYAGLREGGYDFEDNPKE